MRLLIFITLLLAAFISVADDEVVTVTSPENRVAMLELYTSEGCSSCPPSEKWLSELKKSGISDKKLIPLAFHVTYWDYIGWKDRFASVEYDQRQRKQVQYSRSDKVYTPQFMLSGGDYRTYSRFIQDVRKIVAEPASVDITMSASNLASENINIALSIDTSRAKEAMSLYLVLYEDDLDVQVEDGENEGELLHHDFVVRHLYGPFNKEVQGDKILQSVAIDKSWKKQDLYLVAFAQSSDAGDIFQAVRLKVKQ